MKIFVLLTLAVVLMGLYAFRYIFSINREPNINTKALLRRWKLHFTDMFIFEVLTETIR